MKTHDHFLGCLLGGAIGDALGAPIEFLSWHQIKSLFGPKGITSYVEHPDGTGEFTDDTQMLLFTAEGLVSYLKNHTADSPGDYITPVHEAYRRWLHTQEGSTGADSGHPDPGHWLITRRELHKRRAPGNTCLSSLRQGRGRLTAPLNNSKGCGTIMRIAPVGLVFQHSMREAFEAGIHLSVLTHGHPSGYFSGGFMAALVAGLAAGHSLSHCISQALEIMHTWDDHNEVTAAVQAALDTHQQYEGRPLTVEAIEQLGGAWVAEEALAISLLCALHHPTDFRQGVLAAVNHGGDSDSTGAITGNLLGLMLGAQAIPGEWKEKLRYRDIVEQMAGEMISRLAD